MIMHRAGVAPVDAAAFLGHSLEVHISTYLPASGRGARSAAAALGRAMSRRCEMCVRRTVYALSLVSGQYASDQGFHLSGWGDLNSRPLDPQIGGDVSARLEQAWT